MYDVPFFVRLGVAVSGGSDSVALTFLANQYFKHMVAITVDHQLVYENISRTQIYTFFSYMPHRLRPESRQESLQAKSIMESLGRYSPDRHNSCRSLHSS